VASPAGGVAGGPACEDHEMERLWSPWRAGYVSDAGSHDGCFLCAAAKGESDELVVARDSHTVTLLNRFPYNTGHLMVAPLDHLGDLLTGGDEPAAAMMVAARRAMRALATAMHPDGFNLGVNQGEAAGASVEHVHLHVVPRWSGDTNFMPVVGGTKVLPELLEETAARLRPAFAGLT
jgi:ATP adenylyltransferase